MQIEFMQHFPSLDIQLLGVNDEAFPSGNESITQGRMLPWVQDVDENNDNVSDAWAAWDIEYRDVAIVDQDNEMVTTFNLTTFNLATGTNYEDLKQLFIDAAATPPETIWQSPIEPLDINNDGVIAPLDALLVINELDSFPGGVLPDSIGNQAPYIDPTGDGRVAPLDALNVINQLNFNASDGTPAAALSLSTEMESPVSDSFAALDLSTNDADEQTSGSRHDIIDRVFAATEVDHQEVVDF